MNTRWMVIAPLTVAIGLSCCIIAQRQLDARRTRDFEEELLYLPNEKLLNHFTGGMSSVVANLLWLKCIQYTAEEFHGDNKYIWLDHMTDVITRLDPYFVDVYYYGGIFLAALKADGDASINLLKRGMVHNPDAWILPHEIAMVHLLNRRDEPNTPVYATQYLGMAVATGTAPQRVIDLASNIARMHDLDAFERAMWEDMARNSDERMLRNMAERKLMEIAIEDTCAQLSEAAALFENRHQRLPESLDELVTGGIIEAVPEDPLGGRYFIAEGEVFNTTLLDISLERRRNRILGGIRRYHNRTETWPPSLNAVLEARDLGFIPEHPYPGRDWHYTPETGEVE